MSGWNTLQRALACVRSDDERDDMEYATGLATWCIIVNPFREEAARAHAVLHYIHERTGRNPQEATRFLLKWRRLALEACIAGGGSREGLLAKYELEDEEELGEAAFASPDVRAEADEERQLRIAFPPLEPPRLIDPPDPVVTAVPEGRVREVIRNERERNRDIAAKKKQQFIQKHGRLFCEVCGWEPPTTLGEAAHSAIEGHHNDPIADSDPDRTTEIDDLSLVCGNCHALLHSSEKVLTVQELRSLLQKQ